jgi:DNA polymerase III subunit delta'
VSPAAADRDDPPAPRANPHFVGHAQAEAALLAAWRSGRLPHGWLVTGPRGVGKATLAFRFAKFLLAGGAGERGLFGGAPADLGVDPEHPAARLVASGGHSDLLTIERTVDDKGRLRGGIVVDDVRELGGFLHLTPGFGGWRVVVIDSADEMNRHAANAVLKLLEEPPRQALLLLVSHAPGRLLPTIRSRCRRLALGPLAEREVAALLGRYRPGLEAADRELLVRLADGSIGRALALSDETGLTLCREVGELLQELPALDVMALHAQADRFGRATGAEGFRTAGELLGDWLARLARAAATGEPPAERLPGEGAHMRRLLGAARLDQWVALWEKVTRLIAGADEIDLDRRQLWISALLAIEGQVRR